MNPDSHDLIQRHMAGLLTDDEAAVLQTRLKADTDLRRLYLHYMNLDVALEAQAGSRDHVIDLLRAAPLTENKPAGRWLSWRPLATAAAGMVIGLFSASLVFANFAARMPEVKRMPVPLANPGFESDLGDARGDAASQNGGWIGGIDGLAHGESEVEPVEGQSMLRVKPQGLKKNARIYQLIDLAEVSREPIRELELSASFRSDTNAISHYYGVHLMAFDESVVVDHQLPLSELIEGSLAAANQNLKVKVGEEGWRKVTVRMEVPPSASRLIICLSARAIGKESPPANRYIDDVKLWAVSKTL